MPKPLPDSQIPPNPHPWRVDLIHIARLHIALADVAQGFDPAIGAHHNVLADLPRLAARHAEGTVFAAVGQDARGHDL